VNDAAFTVRTSRYDTVLPVHVHEAARVARLVKRMMEVAVEGATATVHAYERIGEV